MKTDLARPVRLLPDGEQVLQPDARGQSTVLIEAGSKAERVVEPVVKDP